MTLRRRSYLIESGLDDDLFDGMSKSQLSRIILKRAAKQTKVRSVKSWLLGDEQGKWDKRARELIRRMETPEMRKKIEQQGLTGDQVIEQMAVYLALMALEASKKKSR